ncbi:MAG: hypothetical protein AAGF12_11715 [Myxococcota bacterium]
MRPGRFAAALSDMVRGFRCVVDHERALRRSRVSEDLPASVRAHGAQWLGTMSAGCTATHGIHERCDFACTACYLATTGNRTPPLPFPEVKAQLERIRAHVGPAGNVQITAGEVTLLPVEDLVRIVRYARTIGLDPMVMTHGQTFLEQPAYLHRLMVESELSKIAVHVDSTQRGRRGVDSRPSEAELMTVRDQVADLVRHARRTTGRPLYAAHTVTVTDDNIGEVSRIVRWFLANADAIRMLSFQPTADVGRTRASALGGRRVFDALRQSVGYPLHSHTFVMGHPDCNFVALGLVVRFGDRREFVELKRRDPREEALFDDLLAGPLQGFYIDDARSSWELLGRSAPVLLRAPTLPARLLAAVLRRTRARERRWLPAFLRAVARGEPWSVHSAMFVVHNFMGRDELATPRGEERIRGCAFRVPVGDRMVSMCELNGTELRRSLNVDQTSRLIPASRLVG